MDRRTGMERIQQLAAGLTLLLLMLGDAVAPIRITASVSVSAAVTALLTYGFLLLLPAISFLTRGSKQKSTEPRQPRKVPKILWIFLAWALMDTVTHGTGVKALQNISCYFLFVGSIQAFSRLSEKYDIRFAKAVVILGWLRATVYAVELGLDGFGAAGVFPRRSFAIQALLIMAVMIPFGGNNRWCRLLPFVLLLEITLSGSRTAMAVGAVLLSLSMRSSGVVRLSRTAFRAALIGLAGYFALILSPDLQERFFSGDLAWNVQGVPLNAEGRAILWSIVTEHAQSNPWTGFGAGSASHVINEVLGTQDQPHNEYLRLWHDFGYIGLGLWLIGYLLLMVRCWQGTRGHSTGGAAPHYAALLALLGIGLMAITDNVFVYYYAMVPLGAMVGISLAQPGPDTERRSPTRPAACGRPRTNWESEGALLGRELRRTTLKGS
ncbi:O-antigen ligase family protein [Streptomyces yaanensis]|uniref:O-antigen ligase family protein n=1 Tax=Streptomyces yaanensis TaxID=1142239 RepID=A0ABV7SBT2_9ACTN|nr:O-antigen ligase family protein [Streptomyces sp. CGMCC 4.7035]WNB96739.1 O-antigen ligase family protein [Streptomyces sp. CGMCC 4.7035]